MASMGSICPIGVCVDRGGSSGESGHALHTPHIVRSVVGRNLHLYYALHGLSGDHYLINVHDALPVAEWNRGYIYGSSVAPTVVR